MNIVITVFYGLITLGILVLVHELGHFLVGKACGIRVTAFSIGFGRGIFSFERGGTLYKIGWIPFGGYCRFAGDGEDLSDDRKGEPDEFYERPAWARLLTISAGVVFNFALAILIFFIISLAGNTYTSYDNRISVADQILQSEETSFPAAEAGLLSGDRIISVNGKETPNFRRIQEEIATRADRMIELEVERGGESLSFSLKTLIRSDGMGYIGIYPFYQALVEEVEPGLPADRLGIVAGDLFLTWNQNPIDSLPTLKAHIAESKNTPSQATWLRDGEVRTGTLSAVNSNEAWIIGFRAAEPELSEYTTEGLGLGEAFLNSFKLFGENIKRIVEGIGLLFHKEVDAGKSVAGPLRIVYFSGQIMKESSLIGYLTFLAMISIALGFFNLLPIPAADGGHIVLTTIEMIRRKRFSFAVLQRVQLVGMVLLFALFIFVMFFDLINIFR